TRQRSRQSTSQRCRTPEDLLGECIREHQVANDDSTAGPQHAQSFGKDPALPHRKVKNTVRDDHVYGFVRERQFLDQSLSDLTVGKIRGGRVPACACHHLPRHFDSDRGSATPNSPCCEERIDAGAAPEVEHIFAGTEVRVTYRICHTECELDSPAWQFG